jgi:hypothetical protein
VQSKVIRQRFLELGQPTQLEIYLLSTGEKRVEIKSAGLIVGKPDYWIRTVLASPSTWLDRLKAKGFTGELKDLSPTNSTEIATTISLKDFTKLIAQEAIQGNTQAIVILAAFAEAGLEKLVNP